MAQRISQQPSNAIPYARESLPFSALGRGNGAMNPSNIGRTNPEDGGNFSKPYANAQTQRNQELAMQEAMVNGQTNVYQQTAAFQGQTRTALNDEANRETKEKTYMNAYLANVISAQPGGGANVQEMARITSGPENEGFMKDIMLSNMAPT